MGRPPKKKNHDWNEHKTPSPRYSRVYKTPHKGWCVFYDQNGIYFKESGFNSDREAAWAMINYVRSKLKEREQQDGTNKVD